MKTLSTIIITKNEEAMLADCIDSLSFCDEILVIDSASTDRTAEIAKHFGASVYEYESNSFAERRNFGLEKAKGQWVFYIDADERVTPELRESIVRAVSEKNNQYSGYKMSRKNFYLGNNPWPANDVLERLFKKRALKEWYGVLHETPRYDGELSTLDGYLHHYTHRDLTSMLAKTIEWSGTEAKLRYDANHPKMTWWRFPRVMFTAFFNSYIKQKGYSVGAVGLIESSFQAFSMFITYARLWEMQRGGRS